MTRRLAVVVRAQIPTSEQARPGMFARMNVLLSTRPNAVVIPEQAIWPQGRDTFVYRVVDSKAALPSRARRTASR